MSGTAGLEKHYTGCLLGGAVGDALGYPIEFFSLQEIRRRYGSNGATGYPAINRAGAAEISDDTQMTLFTAVGLLAARDRGRERGIWSPPGMVHRAYLDWLRTQEERYPGKTGGGSRLLDLPELWHPRAPGNTCLSALRSGKMGTPTERINNSKGCGGIMRAAPVGLAFRGEDAFRYGCETAAITHGHPSGYLSSGVLAQIIAEIVHSSGGEALSARGRLAEAVRRAVTSLRGWPEHEETLAAVESALAAAGRSEPPCPETVESLGGGWVGEEALAISLYCALVCADRPDGFREGALLAVNHSGDSDSTGAITGNILGALLGADAIPRDWVEQVELRGAIEQIAVELIDFP